jgi:hypothetical protein
MIEDCKLEKTVIFGKYTNKTQWSKSGVNEIQSGTHRNFHSGNPAQEKQDVPI